MLVYSSSGIYLRVEDEFWIYIYSQSILPMVFYFNCLWDSTTILFYVEIKNLENYIYNLLAYRKTLPLPSKHFIALTFPDFFSIFLHLSSLSTQISLASECATLIIFLLLAKHF